MRTRTAWTGRTVVVLIAALWWQTASAATYYVRSAGDDRADGASARTAFRTLVRAAQALDHGDTAVVGPGTYREAVLIAERTGTADARLAIRGRHFVLAHNDDGQQKVSLPKRVGYCLIDVAEPLKPRLVGKLPIPPMPYTDVRFTREGHLIIPVSGKLQFKLIPCQGLDARGNPAFDFDHPRIVGPEKDPTPRGLGHKGGIAVDPTTDDIYYLAVTAQHKKMVPFWGASGTGVGKSRADGRPLWFALSRYRLEGARSLRSERRRFDWTPTGAQAGAAPTPARTSGRPLEHPLRLPRVAALGVNGDWAPWEKAGVVPQVVSLPIVSWGRSWPDDLMQTFRAGAAVGALAHDGKHLYACFLVTDDTPHFDADDDGGRMWMVDSIELWVEEEQFGLGFVKSGRPALHKYRFHSREGKPYAPGYALPQASVWGKRLPSIAGHPLSRHLARATGASFEGRRGCALMAKIPFEDIKLVGGIAGRKGGEIRDMSGSAGETVRIGVAFDGVSYWGREQDFKVYWPCGLMFSDPTRNVPFVLGD